MGSITVIIDANGTARHLVDESSERLGDLLGPKISTKRVSHVESFHDLSNAAQAWLGAHGHEVVDVNVFWADLLPVNGPVLGPFDKYAEAIAAEVAWLQSHNFPDITR